MSIPFLSVINRCTSAIALLLTLAAGPVHSQPAQPTLTYSAGPSNIQMRLTTEQEWFYTLQESRDLSDWKYAGDYLGTGTPLQLASTGTTNDNRYFRVRVNPPNSAVNTNYGKWTNANPVAINNGIVEAIIVPQANRVMQFRFLGETKGAFWESAGNSGKTNVPTSAWIDYGGDKAWVAPQNSWGSTWPPPDFDKRTNSVSISNGIVTMVRDADSRFGIRCTRTIELLFNEPVMRIKTLFERVNAPSQSTLLNSNIAIWIDCQVAVSMASRCYVPVPSPSIFPNGFTTTGDAFFGPAFTTNFTRANGLISFGPDSASSHKLGFDTGTLVLVGTNLSLRLESPRVPGATYTAGGSSAEVYTAKYSSTSDLFELEMLSPAPPMAVGDRREFVVTYSLFHRTETTTDAEAQKVLNWKY